MKHLKKIFFFLRHLLLSNKIRIGSNSIVYLKAKIYNISKNKNNIVVGNNSHIKGELLVYAHGGKITIGDYCIVGPQTKIWSSCNIEIGNRVLLAHNINIHDNNAHPINAQQRHEHFKAIITTGHPSKINLGEKPIVIEDDVWIGFNAVILKGVTIGKGSIIAANSLVKQNVPPNVMVAGNPAVIIKQLS